MIESNLLLEPVKMRLEDASSSFTINALDIPDDQGQQYKYSITHKRENSVGVALHSINFQKGPLLNNRANGITEISLLEVIKHRIEMRFYNKNVSPSEVSIFTTQLITLIKLIDLLEQE